MTLTELISRVRAVVEDSSGTYITDDEITDWLNEAQLDLAARLRHGQKEYSAVMGDANTSVANGTIDLPADFIAPISLRLDTDDVKFVADDEFWLQSDEGMSPPHTLGRVFNDKIELYPAPITGTAFKLRYIKEPTDLSSGADIPSLPDQYHKKLVRYAQAHARLKENAEGQSDRYMAMYEDGLPSASVSERLMPGPLDLTFAAGPWDTTDRRHI